MIVTPILTLLFFVVGMGGAYFVAVIVEHVDQGQWIANLRDIVEPTRRASRAASRRRSSASWSR